MLLAKESDPVQNLASPGASRLQSLPQIGILALEPLDSFRRDFRAAARSFNCLHPRFRLQGAPAEGCQLVAKMTNELLKLVECLHVRMIAVGFQVCSLGR